MASDREKGSLGVPSSLPTPTRDRIDGSPGGAKGHRPKNRNSERSLETCRNGKTTPQARKYLYMQSCT